MRIYTSKKSALCLMLQDSLGRSAGDKEELRSDTAAIVFGIILLGSGLQWDWLFLSPSGLKLNSQFINTMTSECVLP